MKKILVLMVCTMVFSCKPEGIDKGGMLITGAKTYGEIAEIIMKETLGVNSEELFFERFVNSLRKYSYTCGNETLGQSLSEVKTSSELQNLLKEKTPLIAESQPLDLPKEYVTIVEYDASPNYSREQIRDKWLRDCNIAKAIKQSHLKEMAFLRYERNWVLILR